MTPERAGDCDELRGVAEGAGECGGAGVNAKLLEGVFEV